VLRDYSLKKVHVYDALQVENVNVLKLHVHIAWLTLPKYMEMYIEKTLCYSMYMAHASKFMHVSLGSFCSFSICNTSTSSFEQLKFISLLILLSAKHMTVTYVLKI
jgi:hypothetical protein